MLRRRDADVVRTVRGSGWVPTSERRTHPLPRTVLTTLFLAILCWAQDTRVDFTRQIHPILASRCLPCHSEEKRSGGLTLATLDGVLAGGRSGAAIRPGNPANSLLVRRVIGEVQPAMPFGGDPLAAGQIALIKQWIRQGARATPTSAPAKAKWEPPLLLDRPEPPRAAAPGWSTPIDRFVAAYMARHKIVPPPPVSDALFARRAYLDAWGLLPAPEELHAFLDDRSPDKRSRLVERLLAGNRQYAENWITFWNDLLRNDEGVNYAGSRKSITEWLLPALESNMPYDRFVARLLNPTGPGDPEGFLVGVNWRGDISASQTPAMQAAQNSAQVFLGVNLKCNSCHDSFISKWKLKDAYSLAAYFSADPKLELFRCDAATGQYAEPAFLYPALNHDSPSGSLNDRHATAAAIFTDPRDGRLPRTLVNRIWQRLLGRGIVEQVDEMDGEPWSPELLDWLASDFVDHGSDVKYLIATIMTSRAYQLPAPSRRSSPPDSPAVARRVQPRAYVFRGPEVRRMTAEEFADNIGAITGEWRVHQPDRARKGEYTREWRLSASMLTRALGRPIRDQVVTTRPSEATTLQALELVNGELLTHWLGRGALKMLGELPPEPESLFDSGTISGSNAENPPDSVAFDIDVSKADRLWLLVQDLGSYAPEFTKPVWAPSEFIGPKGVTPLSNLHPVGELRAATGAIEFKGHSDVAGVRANCPSRLAYDISGRGFTRFRGRVAVENSSLRSDIIPKIRFFIFQAEPNMERLVPVSPGAPAEGLNMLPNMETGRLSPDELVDRVFWYALSRGPSLAERRVALAALRGPAEGKASAAGLADLLWSVMMSPEYQLIY
jgi:hypothetical protein